MPLKRKDLSGVDWHSLFAYNDGSLIWKHRPESHFATRKSCLRWNTIHAGTCAGSMGTNGYRSVKVYGREWLEHRVIFVMHNGPDALSGWAEVDHIDTQRQNNRIENLRACSHGQNQTNSGPTKHSCSGLRGITKNTTGWMARVRVDGKRHYVGTYPTKGLAAVAYAKASLRLHGRFSSFFRAAA